MVDHYGDPEDFLREAIETRLEQEEAIDAAEPLSPEEQAELEQRLADAEAYTGPYIPWEESAPGGPRKRTPRPPKTRSPEGRPSARRRASRLLVDLRLEQLPEQRRHRRHVEPLFGPRLVGRLKGTVVAALVPDESLDERHPTR